MMSLKLTDDFLSEKISIFEQLQHKTSDNVHALSKSTDKAICAIQDKDETVLAQVLEETKELRKEIEKLKESVYKDELTNTLYNVHTKNNQIKRSFYS